MKPKSKLCLALELGLLMSALPLLLLGCGGGGGGAGSQTPASQYLADLTGGNLRNFYAGSEPMASFYYYPGYFAYGYIQSATFSGGSYTESYSRRQMTAGGTWGAASDGYAGLYYLYASGWAPYPLSGINFVPADGSHIDVTSNILTSISSRMTVNMTDLSGKPIVASSAVPAVTALGMASAVSPAVAIYPAGSYEYDIVTTATHATAEYVLYATPDYAVTTTAGPLSNPLNLASYRMHTTKADPVCPGGWGYALVNPAGTGDTYDVYVLNFPGSMPIGTFKNCQNASISASAAKIGTVDLSLVTVNGTQMVQFINLTGSFTPNDVLVDSFVAQIPGDATGYFGFGSSSGTSTSTSYELNKTAMDAALTAWGMPTF